MNEPQTLPTGYSQLLEDISTHISTSRVRAALGISRELVLLYWSIGREILLRQEDEGWGAKVIDRLGRDLQARFPGVEGFSPRNLKYMRSLAQAWPDPAIVPQRVALLPWVTCGSCSTRSRSRTHGSGTSRPPLNMDGAGTFCRT